MDNNKVFDADYSNNTAIGKKARIEYIIDEPMKKAMEEYNEALIKLDIAVSKIIDSQKTLLEQLREFAKLFNKISN